MNKYELLAAALTKAAVAARPLGNTEDGGTCNFDALELSLPHYNENATLAAISVAGLHGFKTTVLRCSVFVINPPVGGRQGNARTRQAEKMRDIMKAEGFNASVYYQMD